MLGKAQAPVVYASQRVSFLTTAAFLSCARESSVTGGGQCRPTTWNSISEPATHETTLASLSLSASLEGKPSCFSFFLMPRLTDSLSLSLSLSHSLSLSLSPMPELPAIEFCPDQYGILADLSD